MSRPTFTVQLQLLSSADGGRSGPIKSNYRPSFDVGSTGRDEEMLADGQIILTAAELAPGAETTASIEPLRPEYWGHVKRGMTIAVIDGSRIVGHATVLDRAWPPAFTPAVATFVRAANDFRKFVSSADKLNVHERLAIARQRLLVLYSAGTELPRVETVTDRQAPTYPAPERWPGFEVHDAYWEVFDPYEDAEPVAKALADDVLDIYRDVRRGLWFWEKGEMADAVWEWRFSFESHWGNHAVDALRALHRACAWSAPAASRS